MIRPAFVFNLLVVTSFPALCSGQATDPPDYEKQIKPLLARHCYICHGALQQKGGLRLDTADAIRKGGHSGPAVKPSDSAGSLLFQAISGSGEVTPMPYKRPRLSDAEIALLKRWIDAGCPAPENEVVDESLSRRYSHWAFLPPVRRPPPMVQGNDWVRTPIDRFILARLEAVGLAPSPEADRVTLIRRLSLDLLGLPPTPEEVAAFVNDPAPDAYERLVDRLLASPHYGERWGRLWLDVARYADSHGYSIDAPREIWKYRDWVIAAFNADLPYDRFVIEQMAGDMLPNATLEQRIATGFHRNTPINMEGGIDQEQFRNEAIYDRVNTTGTAFLGLTLSCARCHDHKFDPISQREYFQLFAFLNNCDEPTLDIATPDLIARRDALRSQIRVLEEEQNKYYLDKLSRMSEAEKSRVKPEIIAILSLGVEQRDEKQKQAVVEAFKDDPAVVERAKTLADLKKRLPKFPTTLVLQERPKPRETRLHIQGDFTRLGDPVSPGVPAVLHPLPSDPNPNRLTLAKWLVDPANPLLARVTVNRLWQAYFGKGLVETENDFGTQGEPPTHPELLDWLATEFIANGWSQKAIHRLIVTSAVYRQASRHRSDLVEKDPNNRLLARQNRLRLDAELVRDAALRASGLLHARIGGPSVFPPQPDGVYRFTQLQKTWNTSTGPDRYRRGMYIHFWRSAPYPALQVFDAPDGVNCCTRRTRSNTPLQALTLLNDEAFLEFAQALGRRLLREAPGSDADRIVLAYRLCLGRSPSPEESDRLLRFVEEQRKSFKEQPAEAAAFAGRTETATTDPIETAAWVALARVVLNLDEFITRE
ncbi:MAG: PSD1 and planctomycete cytochrome C domain-containing protein [Gemmatales bacterium]|nr:PSD1 and planctomycete cytochrome C domain-containing protein [Gemmatales bacterium]MDW8385923.1 PSD1 and planctomycete cytochrome C domain-containing protein [Gemmatales bacterium]